MEQINLEDYDGNDIFWKDFINIEKNPYVLDSSLDGFKCQLVFLVKKSDFSKKDYPLALGYMASLIRMNKGKVKINVQDCENYNPDDFKGFELVCFFPMVALFSKILGYAEKIKSDFPDTKICFFNSDQHQHEMILCNPDAMDFSKNMMESCNFIDYILIGECEKSFIELCKNINKNIDDCSQIPACLYRKEKQLKISEIPIQPVDFRFLPFASRDYLEKGIRDGINSLSPRIQSTRGCMSPCYYCAESCSNITLGGRKMPVLQRDINLFLDEIELLQKFYKVVFFNVIDSSFEDPGLKGMERMEKFCDEINKRGIKASFKVHMRIETADRLSDSFFIKLKQTGVDILGLGVESGIEKELKAYKKIATPEQSMKNVLRVESMDSFFLVLGHMMFSPVLELEDLQEKIAFLEKIHHGWDYLEMSNNVLIFPGTKYHQLIKEQGLELNHEKISPTIPYRFKDERVRFVANEMGKLKKRCPESVQLNNLLYDCLNIISRYHNDLNKSLWIKQEEFKIFRDSIHKIMDEIGEININYMTELINLAGKNWNEQETDIIYKKIVNEKIKKLLQKTKTCLDNFFDSLENSGLSAKKLYLKTWMSLINTEINTSEGEIGN